MNIHMEKLLKDYSDMEKGAYLGAISSIATADHSASEEEIEYIMALADSADLSEDQKKGRSTCSNRTLRGGVEKMSGYFKKQ